MKHRGIHRECCAIFPWGLLSMHGCSQDKWEDVGCSDLDIRGTSRLHASMFDAVRSPSVPARTSSLCRPFPNGTSALSCRDPQSEAYAHH